MSSVTTETEIRSGTYGMRAFYIPADDDGPEVTHELYLEALTKAREQGVKIAEIQQMIGCSQTAYEKWRTNQSTPRPGYRPAIRSFVARFTDLDAPPAPPAQPHGQRDTTPKKRQQRIEGWEIKEALRHKQWTAPMLADHLGVTTGRIHTACYQGLTAATPFYPTLLKFIESAGVNGRSRPTSADAVQALQPVGEDRVVEVALPDLPHPTGEYFTGERFRRAYQRAGLTPDEVAELIGLSSEFIKRTGQRGFGPAHPYYEQLKGFVEMAEAEPNGKTTVRVGGWDTLKVHPSTSDAAAIPPKFIEPVKPARIPSQFEQRLTVEEMPRGSWGWAPAEALVLNLDGQAFVRKEVKVSLGPSGQGPNRIKITKDLHSVDVGLSEIKGYYWKRQLTVPHDALPVRRFE